MSPALFLLTITGIRPEAFHVMIFSTLPRVVYRFVEPTSITPYTYQARKRALHAALVIAMRYGCAFMLSNRAASNFDAQNPASRKSLEALKNGVWPW